MQGFQNDILKRLNAAPRYAGVPIFAACSAMTVHNLFYFKYLSHESDSRMTPVAGDGSPLSVQPQFSPGPWKDVHPAAEVCFLAGMGLNSGEQR